MSATASRCSRLAWAAIRALACSAAMPRWLTSRSTCRSGGTSTTITSVEAALAAALGQQRHVVHDDGPCAVSGLHGGAFGRLHPLADQRVHDLVELAAQPGIGEHDLAEALPVQRAVRAEHVLAEGRGDPGQPGRAGLDHLPGGHVRVDEHRAVLRQPPGHLALA